MTNTFLTAQEVADQLICTRAYVTREIRRGNLKAAFIGGRYLITPQAVDTYVAAKAAKVEQAAKESNRTVTETPRRSRRPQKHVTTTHKKG